MKTLKDIIESVRNNIISIRSFVSQVKANKDLLDELMSLTSFVTSNDINENIYCVIKGYQELPKCRFCGKPLKWSGRMNVGYRDTCGSKECDSKNLAEIHQGQTVISVSRDKDFIKWQNDVTEINDDIVKEHIKYDKYIPMIKNPIILNYLKYRFNDSDSTEETLKRIELGIETKPLCPVCGKPVTFVGRKGKMFTIYCSNTCSGSSNETIQKKKDTQKEHWGTENCYDSSAYKQLNQERYGVDYIAQRKDVIDKRKETIMEHYGTMKLCSIDSIKEKIISSNYKRFGYPYAFLSPSVRERLYETYIKNGKIGTSNAENNVYEFFKILGFEPERQYNSKEFPYCVDFYLKEYDLYIEYQGSQYHHFSAYFDTDEDKAEVERLLKCDKELKEKTGQKNTQYTGMINIWTGTDVKKRNFALEHHLNYLELYVCNSVEDLQFQLMMYFGSKNGDLLNSDENTLKAEYEYYKKLDAPDINYNYVKYGKNIIKHFQGSYFYRNEYNMYANNPVVRRKLIQDRMRVLNKKEEDLTMTELIYGFKSSGIYYGYSHFNPSITNWFVKNYNIKTLYDPCGGWGHHFLGMLKCEKIIYNDINRIIFDNVVKMKEYFNIDNLVCNNGDASAYRPEDVDAFFMCPPYFNIEKYGNNLFKDIDEYKFFLNSIFNIWKENKASVFGIVLREDFIGLIDATPSESYLANVGHTKYVGKKKFNEYMYIFKK